MALPDDDWIRRNGPDWLAPMARELLVVYLSTEGHLCGVAFELGVKWQVELQRQAGERLYAEQVGARSMTPVPDTERTR